MQNEQIITPIQVGQYALLHRFLFRARQGLTKSFTMSIRGNRSKVLRVMIRKSISQENFT